MTPEEARKNMCIYGDNPIDRPEDISVVFMRIMPPEGYTASIVAPGENLDQYMYHASLLMYIEEQLTRFGDGHLKNGFDTVYKSGMILPINQEEMKRRRDSCRRIDLGEGVIIEMEYWENSEGLTPVISRIYSREHLKKAANACPDISRF